MSQLPDGPSTSLGELLHIFTSDPFTFLKASYEKYGDMFTIQLGTFNVDDYAASGSWVFLCNAEYVKTVYKTNTSILLAGAGNDIQFGKLIPKQASVTLDGPKHLERRKILSKLVQGDLKIRQLTAAISEIVKDEIASFPNDQAFPLTPALRSIARKIMGRLLYGSMISADAAHVNARLGEFGDPDFPNEDRFGLARECEHVLKKMIGESAACPYSGNGDDKEEHVFSVLMNAYKNEHRLDENDVAAELLNLTLGGSDTAGSSIAWILAWIFSNPQIREKIQKEIQNVFTNDQPTASEFDQLHYLEAVIKESGRISPLLFTSSSRLLIQPLQLGDYTLPSGSMVVNCPYVIHTRVDYYENPLEFRPERFLGIDPDPYRWLPFGGGIRRCLGMAFALYEMKVVIATLLHQCKFDPISISTKPELQGVFFAPQGSLLVKLATGIVSGRSPTIRPLAQNTCPYPHAD